MPLTSPAFQESRTLSTAVSYASLSFSFVTRTWRLTLLTSNLMLRFSLSFVTRTQRLTLLTSNWALELPHNAASLRRRS